MSKKQDELLEQIGNLISQYEKLRLNFTEVLDKIEELQINPELKDEKDYTLGERFNVMYQKKTDNTNKTINIYAGTNENSIPSLTATSDTINYTTLEEYLAEHNNEIEIEGVTYIFEKTTDLTAPYVAYRKGTNEEKIGLTPFELKNVLSEVRHKLQLGLNETTGTPNFTPSETSISLKNKLNEAVEAEQSLGETLNLTAPQIEEIEDVLLYELLEYAYDARSFKGQACVWLKNQLDSEEVSDEQKAIYAEALQQISLFKKVYSDYNNILPKELQKSSFTAFLKSSNLETSL